MGGGGGDRGGRRREGKEGGEGGGVRVGWGEEEGKLGGRMREGLEEGGGQIPVIDCPQVDLVLQGEVRQIEAQRHRA